VNTFSFTEAAMSGSNSLAFLICPREISPIEIIVHTITLIYEVQCLYQVKSKRRPKQLILVLIGDHCSYRFRVYPMLDPQPLVNVKGVKEKALRKLIKSEGFCFDFLHYY
jgi:hypothetical protein